MRIKGSFSVRTILDEIVAIPMGDGKTDFSGIISLNPVAQFLFEKLQEEQTEQTLVTALTEEYDVEEATARKDVQDFLDVLRKNNLLQE